MARSSRTAGTPSVTKVSKLNSEKLVPAIKGGGLTGTSSVTESERRYPKGSATRLRTDFSPNTGKRSKTRYLVGGV